MYGDQTNGGPSGYGGPGGYGGSSGYGGYGEPVAHPRNGLGVVALVLGVLGLLLCWIVVGLLPAVLGLVLGIVALRRVRKGRATNRGVALAAVIVGVLATVASLVFTAIYAWVIYTAWNNGGQDLTECVRAAGSDQVALDRCEQDFGNDILERFGIDPSTARTTT